MTLPPNGLLILIFSYKIYSIKIQTPKSPQTSCCICFISITLCNCLNSVHFLRDFGIVNWHFWIWKSLNMANRGREICFIQVIHVRIDIRIYIFISIRPMITKVCKQIHLEEFAKIKLTKKGLVMPSRKDHVTN